MKSRASRVLVGALSFLGGNAGTLTMSGSNNTASRSRPGS